MSEVIPDGTAPASSIVPAGKVHLRVLSWPGEPSRSPFVLLHGLASNARFWELVGERLSAAGHPVYAPDLRGHGQSDKPSSGYDVETVSEDVRALMGSLGISRPVIAGHSWGGMIALHLAGRPGPAGAALIDGGIAKVSDYPGATWERTEAALTPPRLAGTRRDDFLKRIESAHSEWLHERRIREIILANFELRPDGTIAPHLTFERHMQVVRQIWEYSTYEAFDRVTCPILMVAAQPKEDPTRQGEVYLDLKRRGEAQARRRIADLRFVWMETDHDVPLARPKELSDLLLSFAAHAGSERAG